MNSEIYNPVLADALFFASIVIYYTDLEFKQDEEDNYIDYLIKIYDYLESEAMIGFIMNTIPKEERESILTYFETFIQKQERYNLSSKGLIENLVKLLPTLLENMGDLIEQVKNDEDIKKLYELSNNIK